MSLPGTGVTQFARIVAVVRGPVGDTEARVRDNYERTKAARFPDWPGEPYIQTGPCPCGCNRFMASGWSADVPDEYVREVARVQDHD